MGRFAAPTHDTMITKYYITAKIGRAGSSQIVYLNKDWDLKKHELVDLTIRKADMSDTPFHCSKQVCKAGGSWVIYCNRVWGYKFDEFVTIKLERRTSENEKPDDYLAEIEDDIGVEDQTGDQDVS